MGGPESVKETAQQRAHAAIAVKMAEIGDKTFRPVERKLIRRVTDDKFDRTKAKGETHADTQRNFSMARDAVQKSQTAAGARPGSGRFTDAVAQTETDAGTAAGFGQVDTEAAAEDIQTSNKANLAQSGLNEAAATVQGMGQVARRSGDLAIERSRESAMKRAFLMDTAATAAGAGAYGYNKFRNPDISPVGVVTAHNQEVAPYNQRLTKGGNFRLNPNY